MIEPEDEKEDYSEALHDIAKDNEKVSKLLAKSYVKGLLKGDPKLIETVLIKITNYFRIQDRGDKIKLYRMEWVLGIPQI